MKKIVTLLMLLCMVCTGAWAQTTTSWPSSINVGKKYTLTSVDRGSLTLNSGKTQLYGTNEGNNKCTDDGATHFAFVKNGSDYYLYSVLAGKYVNLSTEKGTLEDTPSHEVHFAQEQSDKRVLLYYDSNHYVNLGGNSQIVINNWKTVDEGNKFKIEAVGDFTQNITIVYRQGESDSWQKTFNNVVVGTVLNISNYTDKTDEYENFAFTTANPTVGVGASNNTFYVSCDPKPVYENLPPTQFTHFTTSNAPTANDWGAHTKFYTIKCKRDNYYHSNTVYSSGCLQMTSTATGDGKLWAFVNTSAGLHLYNKLEGYTKVMTFASTNDNALCSMTTNLKDRNSFMEAVASENPNISGYEVFRIANGSDAYWNEKDQENRLIKVWKSSQGLWGWGKSQNDPGNGDDGSMFTIELVEEINFPYTVTVTGLEDNSIATVTIGQTAYHNGDSFISRNQISASDIQYQDIDGYSRQEAFNQEAGTIIVTYTEASRITTGSIVYRYQDDSGNTQTLTTTPDVEYSRDNATVLNLSLTAMQVGAFQTATWQLNNGGATDLPLPANGTALNMQLSVPAVGEVESPVVYINLTLRPLPEEGKLYRVLHTNSGYRAYNTNGQNSGVTTSGRDDSGYRTCVKNSATNDSDLSDMFYFKPGENGRWFIISALDGRNVQPATSDDRALELLYSRVNSTNDWSVTRQSGSTDYTRHLGISAGSTHPYWHANITGVKRVVRWNEGVNSSWVLEEVNLSNASEVIATAEAIYEDAIIPRGSAYITYTSQTTGHSWLVPKDDVKLNTDLNLDDFAVDFYTMISFNGSNQLTEDGGDINITCEEAFPFTVGKITRIHSQYGPTSNGKQGVFYTNENNVPYYNRSGGSIGSNYDLWVFSHVNNSPNKFTVRNYANGRYLTIPNTNRTMCTLEENVVDNDSKTSYLLVKKSTYSSAGDGNFVLQTSKANAYFCVGPHMDGSDSGDAINNGLATWGTDANGGPGNDSNCLQILAPESFTTTLNGVEGDGYYGTIYSDLNIMVPTGVTAYRAEVNGESLHLEVAGNETEIIPAGAYILHKSDLGLTEGSKVTTAISMSDPTTPDFTNVLTGTLIEGKVFESDLRYALSGKNGIGFYKYNPATYPVAKAVYIPTELTQVSAFYFDFGDPLVTAIQELQKENEENGIIFDLQGRRIQKAQKGMNIINGRKVLR